MAEPGWRDVFSASFTDQIRGTRYLDSFTEVMRLTGGETVLEFGCRTGSLSRRLADILKDRHGTLVCLDASKKWIDTTKKLLKNYPNVVYLHQNVILTPVEKNHFDRIVCHFSLASVPSGMQERVAAQLCSGLKRHGYMILREAIPTQQDLDKLSRVLEGAGFAVVSSSIIDVPLAGKTYSAVLVRERRSNDRPKVKISGTYTQPES